MAGGYRVKRLRSGVGVKEMMPPSLRRGEGRGVQPLSFGCRNGFGFWINWNREAPHYNMTSAAVRLTEVDWM